MQALVLRKFYWLIRHIFQFIAVLVTARRAAQNFEARLLEFLFLQALKKGCDSKNNMSPISIKLFFI